MSGFSQGFGNVTARAREGFIGEWLSDSHLKEFGTLLNEAPQRAQVSTLTVDSDPGNNVPVTVTINGVDVVTSTGTGLDAAGIAAVLSDAINAEPLVRGQVVATVSAAVVTLTALLTGIPFTVVEAESFLSVATSASALEADPIPFGRAVVAQGYAPGEGEGLGTLATTAAFTAQVMTLTPTYVQDASYRVRVYRIAGIERELIASEAVVGATDLDTTLDALATALEAALPANTVAVAGNAATATALVFTADIAGFEFDVEFEPGPEGASVPTFTLANTTGPNRDTSLNRSFAGVSLRSLAVEAPTKGALEGQYGPNQSLNHAKRGAVWVANSESVVQDDPVYVDLTPTTGAGLLFKSAGNGRVRLGRDVALWKRTSRVAANGIAGVDLKRGA